MVMPDQAAGLRRLLGPKRLRVAPIVAASAGVGKTMFVINFAAAAQRRGLKVLVLDQTYGDIAGALGLRPRYDLLHVLNGDRDLSSVALRGPESVWIIPAPRGIDALVKTSFNTASLCRLLAPISSELDLIVVNSLPSQAHAACRFAAHADSGREAVLLAATTAETITASYSHIKHLVRRSGQQEFRLLINRASTEDAARRVFENVAKAAKENVDALVHYGGYIPKDPALKHARTARQTIFANQPGGYSARAFDSLAASSCDWAVPEFERALEPNTNH
jgi:flagellar biosynthesis protein FlhG